MGSRKAPKWAAWWAELRENTSLEVIGLLVFLAGGFFLLSLLPGTGAYPQELPWLRGMVGWTAPLLAVGLMVTGAVLMLGDRAGFWSVEALVGAELLLLTLPIATFLWQNDAPNWAPQIDGASGGLVGATLGSLTLAAFGRAVGLLLTGVVGAVGLYWLVCYTPLVLLVYRWAGGPPRWMRWRRPHTNLKAQPVDAPDAPVTRLGNFVTAREPAPPTEQTPTPAKLRGRSGKQRAVSPPAEVAASVEAAQGEFAPPTVALPKATRSQRPKVEATQLQAATTNGQLPSIELLGADHGGVARVDVQALQQLIEETLADFDVPVRMVHIESGPTVTQFGVEPLFLERAGQRRKVRVSRIVSLADDLALALAVPAVRIEAPVPGRPYVGIEVPNSEKMMVSLRGILESKAMPQAGALIVPLGRNTAGAPVVLDLAKAPHMLIAGATGAGKSVCINTIITGLLMQHGPERLRFIMVDPKMVELPGYNGIPHLLGHVITDVEQVMGALTWLLLQMDDRYRLFQQFGVRNLDSYNALVRKPKKGEEARQPLPYIVLIIDELADLMMTAAEDVERQICRLAQMARATGIHLVLATQRPSVDVVTGLIKANFPTRIAFAVSSQTDSRVILDSPGAERLLGRGDMLVMRPDAAKLWRVQGCFVADDEITRVVNYWKAQSLDQPPAAPPPWSGLMAQLEDEDELLYQAIEAVQGLNQITTSQLQRKLRIGYPKAARLMDQLEERQIVGPEQGAGQGREVLPTTEPESESSTL